ncbi:hypothetical protein HKCCE3408_18640 [Rhodobacterales bacterium HKCCE3408]|nr:hypothetical protein [Rhodobacterales bacterium HKCCE3408]
METQNEHEWKMIKYSDKRDPGTTSRGLPMVSAKRIGLLIVAPILVVPLSVYAQGSAEEILGGSVIECRGAIAWSDGPDPTTPRVEALQIAAAAAADADRIVIFAAERDTTPEDFLGCVDGLCTAHRVSETGTATSVVRLSRGLDYGSGRVQYDLDTAFTVVSFSGGSTVAETVTGRGGFVCDAALPPGVSIGE